MVDIKDMWKPETEVDKLAREKGIGVEDAWKIIKDREEKAMVQKGWAEQDARKILMEKWVWKYYELGLKPIPIVERGKEPNIEKTSDYFYQDIPREKIKQWLAEGRYQNVALLGGDLACNDFDNPASFTDLKLNTKDLIDSGAWVTETPKEPGRYHIVVRDKQKDKTTRKSMEGIELRQHEHYWLVYPSIHPNGKMYNFLNTKDPEQLILPRETNALAMYDKWIAELKKIRRTNEKNQEILKNKLPFDKSPDCIRLAWENGAQPGERYYTSIGLGSWLQQKGFPLEMAQTTVETWFKEKCETDGRPAKDIRNGAKVGYIKKEYETGCAFWREKTKYCPYPDKKDCPYCETIGKNKRDLLKKYGAIYEDEKGNPHVCSPQLARLLLESDNEHYLVTSDNQTILRYNGSYYTNPGEPHILNRINYYCEKLTSNRIKSETTGFIKNNEYIDREALEQPLNLLNLKNGIFDIITGELIPHDPKYTFLAEIPIDYNKDAECKKWEKFIADVIYPEDIPFMQEVCGYLLHRKYTWSLLLILLGHGRNGKTTFLNVMTAILGKKNTRHIPLQTIAHDQHAKAKLYQIHANLCSEIGSKEVKDTGAIKQLTGGDNIYARELYQNGFEFLNYAKLYFACNILPEIDDKTLAMIERLAVIEFPNTFRRGDPTCDPNLTDKLTTPEELSGILNWMIEGLKRLLKNEKFSEYKDFENIAAYQKKCQDQIFHFINLEIESDTKAIVPKNKIYTHYKKYCEQNKMMPLNDVWFGRKLMQFVPTDWHVESGRKGKHIWKGLKIKKKTGLEKTMRPPGEDTLC